MEWTRAFCATHKEGSKPLSKHQAVQFAIVEMLTEVKLGRTFIDKLVTDHMEGQNVVVETSMAKYWTTEMVKRVADRCMDLLGPHGMHDDHPIARSCVCNIPFRNGLFGPALRSPRVYRLRRT